MDINEISLRLRNFDKKDIAEEIIFLTSIRDHIDVYTLDPTFYSTFLNECLGNIRSILLLRDSAQSSEYTKARILCMEILTLLPQNEVLSNYCLDLAQLCLHLLDRDTDDIGIFAIRNLVFLYRNYTNALDNVVESLLGFASRLCTDIQQSLPQLIQEVVSDHKSGVASQGLAEATQTVYNLNSDSNDSYGGLPIRLESNSSALGDDTDNLFLRGSFSSNTLPDLSDLTNPVRSSVHRNTVGGSSHHHTSWSSTVILPCHRSLRILVELPLTLLHIFQLYPHYMERYFAIFAPNLVSCLHIATLFPRDFIPRISAVSQQQYTSRLQQQYSPDYIPDIMQSANYRSLVQDYIITCSKIIFWFTHFFRGFTQEDHIVDTLRQTQASFIQGFIEVLLLCPAHCLHQRREILVCLRNILGTDFRQGFYSKADVLLDEVVLIGQGRTGYETIKVLSAAIIHEFLVYLRLEYSFNAYNNINSDGFLDIIMKCLHSLTRNILDTQLPLPAQHYCIRSIAFLPDILKKEGFLPNNNQRNIVIRDILLIILWAFSLKIHQLRRQIYNLVIVALNGDISSFSCLNSSAISSTPLKPTPNDILSEFENIYNVGHWLDKAFSYANTQLGHCSVSLLGSSTLSHGISQETKTNTYTNSRPLVIDVLRELRPIIRAVIIGVRQTIFHITTLNRVGLNVGLGASGSGIAHGSSNLDITRYDVRKLAQGVPLNESESRLVQQIFVEGIICSVEYSLSFQSTTNNTSLFNIEEGGHECQILSTCAVLPNTLATTGIQNSSSSLSIMPEEKDLLELLASTMCYIHPQSFGDIIQATFPLLFEWSSTMSPQVALIFHYWGLQQHVAKTFYEAVLPHLITKMDSLMVEPESEYKNLRKNGISPLQILSKQADVDKSRGTLTGNSSQPSSLAGIPTASTAISMYPTDHHQLNLSRFAVDPHIDYVSLHPKILYSRGRTSYFGSNIGSINNNQSKFQIIDPRDDPFNVIQFAPTAAPHGNPPNHAFSFDILTQDINISLLQLNKQLVNLPLPDTFIYGAQSKNREYPKNCDNLLPCKQEDNEIAYNKDLETSNGTFSNTCSALNSIPYCSYSGGIAAILVVTRLLKQLFRFIGQNPQFETILQPYVADLCVKCTTLASSYPSNTFYLSILRSLFRSITPGGKASGIYKEFLSILPWFLDTTIRMQKITSSPYREVWLEISLTVPARLKSLLPYMGQLVDPMLNALESNDPELILLALRSLDLWIDNLHHDFLYPILTNSLHQPHKFQTRPCILVTLCKLLRPAPPIPLPTAQVLFYNFPRYHKNNNLSFYALQSIAFQHATLVGRILGKLGGKNRWFLKDAATLDISKREQQAFYSLPLSINKINGSIQLKKMNLDFKNEPLPMISLDDTLEHIFALLSIPSTSQDNPGASKIIKDMSIKYIEYILVNYLNLFWLPIPSKESIEAYFNELNWYLSNCPHIIEDPTSIFSVDFVKIINPKLFHSFDKNLELFVKTLILGVSVDPELRDKFFLLCSGYKTFVAVYCASRIFIPDHCNLNIYWNLTSIDPVSPFLSGLFEMLQVNSVILSSTAYLASSSKTAMDILCQLVETFYILVGHFPIKYQQKALQTNQLPVLLTTNLVKLCYQTLWSKKIAGCLLLVEILARFPPIWAQEFFIQIIDGLFFISKDSGVDTNPCGERCAEDALETLIYSVFTGFKPNLRKSDGSFIIDAIPLLTSGFTVSSHRLSLLSGEGISTILPDWEELLDLVNRTKNSKKENSLQWWSNTNRFYMELLLDSDNMSFMDCPIRDSLIKSIEKPPSSELHIIRKHLHHICMVTIIPNILSLKPSCRRMAQKCLVFLANATGVSVATLLNISFTSGTEGSSLLSTSSSCITSNTILQLLLSRLQTKLISTCSTPYQLAFIDALCFLTSLRPYPLGIPSTVIRRFVEDILVVVRDEMDSDLGDSSQQKNTGLNSSTSAASSMRTNPTARKYRVEVQIRSIRFLKLVLLHPSWSEYLKSRVPSSLSVPVSANTSPATGPTHLNNISYHHQPMASTSSVSSGPPTLYTSGNIPGAPQIPYSSNTTSANSSTYGTTNTSLAPQSNNSMGRNSEELRWRIIGILFRCVTRRDLEVCMAAHHTLRVIVRIERFVNNQQILVSGNIAQYELLPEDQLRHCLRPVLVHLASATRLTVHVLQGLARLLELLCYCFNVTLGEKLLQHLQRLCWPTDTQRDQINATSSMSTSSSLRQPTNNLLGNQDPKKYEEDLYMAVAMVCVFHLLPQGSDEFVAKVIGTILGTRTFPGIDGTANGQSSLSSFINCYITTMTLSSPFRLPLALFAVHSSQSVVSFLIQQLASDKYANLLIDLIKMPACSVVRVKLYQLRMQLMEATVNRVLEEADSLEGKGVDTIVTISSSSISGQSLPQSIPVVPAFTETYSCTWNGIRVLSSLCEEWPSLLIIDFLEYYATNNKSVLTIIDTLLTLYNTIYNRLIVLTKSGGISSHGNLENKFELALTYQGTVSWQHPWSFFHSQECLSLFKMLIGFYSETNALEGIPGDGFVSVQNSMNIPVISPSYTSIGSDIIEDIEAVLNSMDNVLNCPRQAPGNETERNIVGMSGSLGGSSSNLSPGSVGLGANSQPSHMNPSYTSSSPSGVSSYPSSEFVLSLLKKTIHGSDVKAHLRRRRIDVVLTIATLFGTSSTLDNGPLRDFLICKVPSTMTIQEKRLLFNQLIQRYYPINPNLDVSSILPGTQVACIQLILIPLLEYEFNNCNINNTSKLKENTTSATKHGDINSTHATSHFNESCWLNDAICEGIVTRIILPSLERSNIPLYGTTGLSAIDDPLKVEILKLLILLIRNPQCSEVLSNNKKRIIKNVWNILRTESSMLKSWGYITMCFFVNKYPFPDKILFSILVALTRLYGISEVRLTVRKALDLFIPIMYNLKPLGESDAIISLASSTQSAAETISGTSVDIARQNSLNLSFSLVPSPPRLAISEKSPEIMLSKWLRLMIAILIQDSYNLPLPQQLFHWHIVIQHSHIFAHESVYLFSPILSTVTKLLWSYGSLTASSDTSRRTSRTGHTGDSAVSGENSDNSRENSREIPGGRLADCSGQPTEPASTSSTYNSLGLSQNLPLLPEIRRGICDILLVLTDWICINQSYVESEECGADGASIQPEYKKRKVETYQNNKNLKQELEFSQENSGILSILNCTIDVSSISQLSSLLIKQSGTTNISMSSLIITSWFRLALLSCNTDHLMVSKCFAQMAKILKVEPNSKIQLSWLDLGFPIPSFNTVNNKNSSRSQSYGNQPPNLSAGFIITYQLTLLAGLQVICMYQSFPVIILQLDCFLKILEPVFISTEKVIIDSLYTFLCKILQILPLPSKQLQFILQYKYSTREHSKDQVSMPVEPNTIPVPNPDLKSTTKVSSVDLISHLSSNNFIEESRTNNHQAKASKVNIERYKMQFSKMCPPDNRIDSFYTRLIDIAIAGLWSPIDGESSTLPPFNPVQPTALGSTGNNIYTPSKHYVSFYTGVKCIMSLMIVGVFNPTITFHIDCMTAQASAPFTTSDVTSPTNQHPVGMIFLSYMSDLIIHVLENVLAQISNSTIPSSSVMQSGLMPNVAPTSNQNRLPLNTIQTSSSATLLSTSSNNYSNSSILLLLQSCGELFHILLMTPEVTWYTLNSKTSQNRLINLVRDFGLIPLQGGIIHILITIIGRWMYKKPFVISNYLAQTLNLDISLSTNSISNSSLTDLKYSNNTGDRSKVKVLYLDDIIKVYCDLYNCAVSEDTESYMFSSQKPLFTFRYELILNLLTSWSLICDRHRRHEVHLAYHLLVSTILLEKEEEINKLKNHDSKQNSVAGDIASVSEISMTTSAETINMKNSGDNSEIHPEDHSSNHPVTGIDPKLIMILERCALLGLASPHPIIKEKFLKWFDNKLPRDVQGRLHFLLTSSSFDVLAERFYICQFLELLIPVIKMDPIINENDKIQRNNKDRSEDSCKFPPVLPEIMYGHINMAMNRANSNAKRNQKTYSPFEWWEFRTCLKILDGTSEFGYTDANNFSGDSGDQNKYVSLLQPFRDCSENRNIRDEHIHSSNKNKDEITFGCSHAEECLSLSLSSLENLDKFLNKDSLYCSNFIISTLLFFANTSETLAIKLWNCIFPWIWDNFDPKKRNLLTLDIIDLLSKERHHRVSSAMPSEWTVPCVIMESLLMCESPPELPNSLLLHLATRLRCWHTAAKYLEVQTNSEKFGVLNKEQVILNEYTSMSSQVDVTNKINNCKAHNSVLTNINNMNYSTPQNLALSPANPWSVLAEIYGQLQEEDVVIGIKRTYSTCLETHIGLALMQQAEWSKAQEIFFKNLDSIYNSSALIAVNSRVADSELDRINTSLQNSSDLGVISQNYQGLGGSTGRSNSQNSIANFSNTMPQQDIESFSPQINTRLQIHDKVATISDLYNVATSNISSSLSNETLIWIDSWVSCAKHLNQWNTLNEFAKERKNPQLQLECSSKLQDWTLVEKLVNKYFLHNPVTKLCQAYHSLHDLLLGSSNTNCSPQNSSGFQQNQNYPQNSSNSVGGRIPNTMNSTRSKLAEFERHCSIGYKTVLNFWATLPSIVSNCHIPLLLNFQQYIELQEGFRLSSDIERKLYQDLGSQMTAQNIIGGNISSSNGPVSSGGNSGNLSNVGHANSANIPQYTSSTGSSPGYFEARMLNVWRDRLPNKWDSMILWNDLFVWRNFVFSIITNLISKSDTLSSQAKSLWPSYLQDMPWTMIKFASIARKSHRLPEVSVALLQKLQNHLQISGGDAYRAETFLATLEKVKLCLSDNSQLRTGLNILNMTDFQKCPEPYFDEYRAELLRLKGVITNRLYPNYYIDGDSTSGGVRIDVEHASNRGNTDKVLNSSLQSGSSALPHNPSVSNPSQVSASSVSASSVNSEIITSSMVRVNVDLLSSLKVYPLFARGWITWAQYTDRLLYIHQNMSYAVNAVISYLMGIYLRPDKYSILLSRVLWLLPHDSPEGKYLSLAFKKYSDFLPCAVWLPWIPQLIAGLDRIEGNALLPILNKVVVVFPQSIYFNLRCNYLEKREMAHLYWSISCSESNSSSCMNIGPPPPISSGVYPPFITVGRQRLESLMNTCRIRHGALTLALEHWVEDLVLHCKPDPVDELLCAVRTLFQMTIEVVPNLISQVSDNVSFSDFSYSDHFPSVGIQFLENNIIKRYEQLLQRPNSGNNSTLQRAKNIIEQFWNEFKDDFKVYKANTGDSKFCYRVPRDLTLDFVLEKLKKWKDYLVRLTEKSNTPQNRPLLPELSPTLCDLFHRINIRIEVPGQHLRISSESLYLRNFAVLENMSNNNNPIGGVIYLERALPIVESVTRQSYTLRRIGFLTSSGSIIYFLVQPYSGLQQKVEERIIHLQVALNTLLYRYKETRARNIFFAILPCIPLHPRCRLVEDTGNKRSFTEIVESGGTAIPRYEIVRDLDLPLLLHRRLLNSLRNKRNIENIRNVKEGNFKVNNNYSSNFNSGISSGSINNINTTITTNNSDYQDNSNFGNAITYSNSNLFNLSQQDYINVYNEICENWVPQDILKNSLLGNINSSDQSFIFVKQFTTHVGVLSIFSYILGATDVTPNKMFVSLDTGQVYQSELKSSYVSSTLLIDRIEKVPFRLTRNMQSLMGPYGKNGILPGVMLAFAQCLQKYEFHVRNLLCSLLRDDLYALSMHRALQITTNHVTQQQKNPNVTNTEIQSNPSVHNGATVTNLQNMSRSQYLGAQHSSIASDVLPSNMSNSATNNNQPIQSSGSSNFMHTVQQKLLTNADVREKVDRNVRRMMERIAILTNPRPITDQIVLIDKSILEIISSATDTKNIALMKTTWMPWI
ncbi:hypothetical protein ACR3K2_03980 [Cryptosporidium serpentis]